MNYRTIAEQIFLAGVESVLPKNLIPGKMSLDNNLLRIGDLNFQLESFGNIYVIGAGKASAMMGAEVEKVLGERITGGHIVVKYGDSHKLRHIEVTEAGHPIPDLNGFNATREIIRIAGLLTRNDLVICLISGGGSALLTDVPDGCSPEDMIIVNNLLINCGASIREINTVRKHLSIVKGGQLSRIIYPATLVNLILSDVPGDSLEVIASGPTVPDSTTFLQALKIISDYNLKDKIPVCILKYLNEGVDGIRMETPKHGDPVFDNTYNILAGSNKIALDAARLKALEFNADTRIIDTNLQGDSETVAVYIVETSNLFRNNRNEIKPLCLLMGGETTVRMTGMGRGGRNQHLALLCAQLLENLAGITILSAGTDGNDGPTDAAGAVVDSGTLAEARKRNIDPDKYIETFDSYHFFKKVGGHIITGPTMTNVMDIIVVIVE